MLSAARNISPGPAQRFRRTRGRPAETRRATLPDKIWRQHAEIVDAIGAGTPDRAEALMIEHDLDAARTLVAALAGRAALAVS